MVTAVNPDGQVFVDKVVRADRVTSNVKEDSFSRFPRTRAIFGSSPLEFHIPYKELTMTPMARNSFWYAFLALFVVTAVIHVLPPGVR